MVLINNLCHLLLPSTLLLLVQLTNGKCYDPSPAFPIPQYPSPPHPELVKTFESIQLSLESAIADENYDTTAFSIEVTSSQQTLWSSYHTAREKNESRPGAQEVNGESAYRIASITKTFTVLGVLQQHAEGNLRLDDPVDVYLEGFRGKHKGGIPWKDITLRTLASQLSGIPRDFSQGDLLVEEGASRILGLPPATATDNPECGNYDGESVCTEEDLLTWLNQKDPIFAPKQESTYSNLAFELLGLVLANVTRMKYEDYIETFVLKPLEMTGSSFETPSDSVAVLPKGESWYWEHDEGVQKPTGGLYSTSTDLSKYLRYILTHYNALTPSLNWLLPVSYTTGINSFYGTPWEIFRTSTMLESEASQRAITFYTKSGGLPGYTSIIIMAPEYDLGVTILVGGSGSSPLDVLREKVTVPLIRTAEKLAQQSLQDRYTGTFDAIERSNGLNSSLVLSHYADSGLCIDRWISNGSDVLEGLSLLLPQGMYSRDNTRLQLTPTLLYRNEAQKKGELWRLTLSPSSSTKGETGAWDAFCISDTDPLRYDGRPLNEFVFWDQEGGAQDNEVVECVELTAFQVTLRRQKSSSDYLRLQD